MFYFLQKSFVRIVILFLDQLFIVESTIEKRKSTRGCGRRIMEIYFKRRALEWKFVNVLKRDMTKLRIPN